MISKELLENGIQHRDNLINIILKENLISLKCINGECEHLKVCKSGCKIKLDENNLIVDLEELKKDEAIDCCFYSTVLATFINDIKFYKDLQKKVQEQEVIDAFNKEHDIEYKRAPEVLQNGSTESGRLHAPHKKKP